MILPRVIGHRGAAAQAPENTLASFAKAAEQGAAMVEFDVRLSADGQPVVFHDATLERITPGRGRVRRHNLAELQALGVAGLDEVLALCGRLELAVNIELKPDRGAEAETARVALQRARAVWTGPPPLVSSFARGCLKVAREVAPGWPRGLLAGALPRDWRAAVLGLGCEAVHLDQRRLEARQVARLRDAGLRVLAYTVNDPERARQLWSWGVDAVFSDDPGLLLRRGGAG